MSEAKFTPGPWKVTGNGKTIMHRNADDLLPHPSLPNGSVAQCFSAKDWTEAEEEAKANAALIAAAPELYEMLEFFAREWINGDVVSRKHEYKVIELLKKARGEE